MLQNLNQHTIANDVRMRATSFKGAFLLVEGRSDQKLYVKFTDSSHTQVLPCKDRSDTLGAIGILNSVGFNRAAAIIDADFDRIEGVAPPHSNVFFTDRHDAEMMMMECHQAYSAVMSEFASPDKLATWQAASTKPLLDSIIEESAKIGALMLHSKRTNSGFKFGSFDNELCFSDFTDRQTLRIDRDQLLQHVLNRSQRSHTPRPPIHASVAAILASNYDVRDLARGHDVLDLLGFGLRRTVGSCDQKDCEGYVLERFLRVAYPIECFSQTSLYRDLKAWAAAQGGLQIFR
ncbi:MAG: hypothetical protein CJBNEKGG_02862 [Prosthecobacter sp.]|nr:hypothetical protein [Prosthecobacter sp.]